MDTGAGSNVPYDLIDSLLGQGWGYSKFVEEVQRQEHARIPGLKRKILMREFALFRQEIQEKRLEPDIDDGWRSQSNSLESILKRLKGESWLQSQPLRNEKDERLRTRRLLGKEMKVRCLQNYVKRWDQETDEVQAESQPAGHQAAASLPDANEDAQAYSQHGSIISSTRPSFPHRQGREVVGDRRSRPFISGPTESDLSCSNLPSTFRHDAHSPLSNRMPFTLDAPSECSKPNAHTSFDHFDEDSYSHFALPLEVFSNPVPETTPEGQRLLSAEWFDYDPAHEESQSTAPGHTPLLDDQSIATILPDHFYHSGLTRRPDPASSEYVEVYVAGKREQDPLNMAPAPAITPNWHRLTATFGIPGKAHDLHTPSDMNQNEDTHQNSDTDMLECSYSSDGDNGGEANCIQPQDPFDQHFEATMMTGPNPHSVKGKHRKCSERYRTKIKTLWRQRGELKRAHEAQLSKLQSEFELVIRREAAQEAKIKELQETIQKLEISRQETASMTYDQLTMDLIAQKIVEEKTLKSQSPPPRRCGSTASSGRGSKAKVLRSFEPSTSPLPLRTARSAIDVSSVANRKVDGISNDGQALNGDGHSKSSSHINRFCQIFSKPSSPKVVGEASLSLSPLSPKSFPLKDPRLTFSPSPTQNLVPRVPQVAHDDLSKRLTMDSGYESLRSFPSDWYYNG
ncbi:hypothetical protein IFR05_009538 [Cadophora sp. M221]|nr:hypothetical protein IFR05_009538 [Cadophora sp. M221]